MPETKKVTKTVKKAKKEAELIVEASPENETKVAVKDETEVEVAAEVDAKDLAKAGKRSAKALKAAEEKAAKDLRKAEAKTDTAEGAKAHKAVKPARSRLERRGKKFREAAKLIEKGRLYPLEEAINLAVKTNPAKFDASVELHVNLNVDPRQSDQNVRDTLVLPSGSGKTIRVAVFSDDKVSGADISGVEKITDLLEKNKIDFDVLIATPANMAKLGKYARLLGPRGLMPNPKSGTVTNDIAKALNEAKTGRVEYRVDSTGIIHLAIGKVSAGKDKILANAEAVMISIRNNKPASVKSGYIKAINVTTTMGPAIRTTTE